MYVQVVETKRDAGVSGLGAAPIPGMATTKIVTGVPQPAKLVTGVTSSLVMPVVKPTTTTVATSGYMQWWGNSLTGAVVYAASPSGQGWRNFPTQSSAQDFADYYTAKRAGYANVAEWKIAKGNAANLLLNVRPVVSVVPAGGVTTKTMPIVSVNGKTTVTTPKVYNPPPNVTLAPFYYWADPNSGAIVRSQTQPTTAGAWRKYADTVNGQELARMFISSTRTPTISTPPPGSNIAVRYWVNSQSPYALASGYVKPATGSWSEFPNYAAALSYQQALGAGTVTPTVPTPTVPTVTVPATGGGTTTIPAVTLPTTTLPVDTSATVTPPVQEASLFGGNTMLWIGGGLLALMLFSGGGKGGR